MTETVPKQELRLLTAFIADIFPSIPARQKMLVQDYTIMNLGL